MRAPPFYLWYEIPDEEWDALVALAAAREAVQATVHTSRYWRAEPHLPGICGEWVYELLTGQPMNRTPEVWHDHIGEDFPGVDVKASTFLADPHLKGYGKLKAPLYFATVVDLDQRIVKPLGYATREMLQAAQSQDYGNGSVRRLRAHELVSADELLARTLERRYGKAA